MIVYIPFGRRKSVYVSFIDWITLSGTVPVPTKRPTIGNNNRSAERKRFVMTGRSCCVEPVCQISLAVSCRVIPIPRIYRLSFDFLRSHHNLGLSVDNIR